jgi:hypothetical protein
MVIFNSYSSTADKPRWRVFIPTTVAMPIAAYKAIGEQIMRTVNRADYCSKEQLAANHVRPASPEPSEPVAETIAEPVQPLMSPTKCPKLRRMRELLAEEAAAKVQNDRAQRQAVAIQKWRSALPRHGNRAFFELGVDLRGAGLSMVEIDSVLRQEAGYARHPTERRREIKNIMRRLGGSSRRLVA